MGAPASEDTGPIWVESSIYHDFSEFTHYNPWTGEKCNCAWGKPRHKKRLGKLASQNVRMLRNQDQKIFRTEEGKEFLNQLENFADENPEWERMVPWLASRYKHGDVGLNGHGEVAWGDPGNIAHQTLRDQPYWTNWFNADQHPLRRGVNIMEKTPEEVDRLAREHQIAVRQAQNKQNWLANYGGTSEPIHTFGPEAGQYQGWSIHPIEDAEQAEAESAALNHCFTPETLVRTIDGYRPIVDIKVGDLVLSGDGYYHPVLKKFEHDYNGPLHEIFTRVGVEPICVTPEHPFLAIEGNHARNGKCIPKCKTPRIPKQNFKLDYSRACVVRDRIKAGVSRQVIAQEFGVSVHTVSAISIGKIWVNANEPQRERLEHHFVWTNAEKLSQHRYISSNIPKVTFDLDRIEVPDQFVGNSPFSQRRGPLHYDLTPEFLWLVGLYIAEGSCNSGDIIQYSLHKDEEEYAQRIERFFGQWYKVKRRKDKPEYNGLVLQFGSRRLAQWWREWIGDRSNTKKIPIELFNLPDGKLRHVLDGILAGDGCDSSNELSQTSPMLALQVAEVSLRQGGQPSIGRHFPSHKLPYWSLLEPCGHRPTQRKSANKSGYWALADRVAVKIYRHDIKDYQGKIYNLHIEGDHTYTVQNILVHNCIGSGEQPYIYNIDQGNIRAYSLRDPQGYPHVSWHINPSRDTIGHMQGASGYPKDDYRNLISQFNQAAELPDEESAYEEPLEGEAVADWTAPDPDNVEDLISQYNDIYEWAYNDPDANIGEGTGIYMGTPQWEDIAYDALNNSRVDLDELYKFIKDLNGYWKNSLDQAIAAIEPDDETSWQRKAYWYELNGDYLEGNPYNQMQDWIAPDAENVEEYINQAHPDKHTLQEQALDSGDPVGENTEYWPGESPKWDDIAKSFYGEQSRGNFPQRDFDNRVPLHPVRWSDPDQAATPEQVQDLYDAAISQGVGNLRSLHNALEDYGPDPNIPHEQQNWEQWQRLYNQHIDPNTGSVMHYPIMNRYQAPMFHLNPDNPSQVNYLQAEPREDGFNRYMAPQTLSSLWVEAKTKEPHPNYKTGLPCYCGFDHTKFTKISSLVKKADKLHDFLMNPKSRPDLQTPEAQQFLRLLRNHYHYDKTDALMPWMTREWKKGRLVPSGQQQGQPQYPLYYDAPILNPNTGEYEPTQMPLTQGELNHWADLYHSNHPEKRNIGDIMQKTMGDMHGHVENWNQALANQEQQETASHGQVVHTTPDNWTVRQLNTPDELKAEGDNMGHCCGGSGYANAVQRGDSLIYSLRDPNGQPHSTLEISPTRRSDPEPFNLEEAWQHHPAFQENPKWGVGKPEALMNAIRQYGQDPNDGMSPEHQLSLTPAAHFVADAAGKMYPPDYRLMLLHVGDHDINQMYNQLWRRHQDATSKPMPHGGEVVQIQGKGNQEPIPEYKARLKNWFDTFSPEDKPQWGEDESPIYEARDIEDHHLVPGTEDEYGLAKPQPYADWQNIANTLAPEPDGYRGRQYDYDDGERAFQLAKVRGEIPQFAEAFKDWEERRGQPMIDDHLENNYDYIHEGEAYNPDDPEWDEAAYDDARGEAESELLEDHPYYNAINHINSMLAPHYDPTTQFYRNERQQGGAAPMPQQQTLSKKKELKPDDPEYYEKEEIDEPYCHLTIYGEPKKAKIAVMTLPQQIRAWQQLAVPGGSQTIHQFPDNWSVKQHIAPESVQAVGQMMRNCWQNDRLPVNWQEQANEGWGYHTLHDENDIPRVGFYTQNYPEMAGQWPPTINQALGPRNRSPSPEEIQKLQEFGRAKGWSVPTFYPQKNTLSSAPWGNHDPLVCPGCGSALLEPQQIGKDWSSYCPSCHGTYKIPPFSPLLQLYQNEWAEYPEELKQVGKPSPWADIVTSAKEWEEIAPEDAFPSSSLGKYLKHIDKGITHEPAPKKSYLQSGSRPDIIVDHEEGNDASADATFQSQGYVGRVTGARTRFADTFDDPMGANSNASNDQTGELGQIPSGSPSPDAGNQRDPGLNTLWFPSIEDAKAANQAIHNYYGTPEDYLPGEFMPGLLDNALQRAWDQHYTSNDRPNKRLINTGAHLLRNITQAQSFYDGNHRTARALTGRFFEENGLPHIMPMREEDQELAKHMLQYPPYGNTTAQATARLLAGRHYKYLQAQKQPPPSSKKESYRDIFARVVYENFLATQKKIDSQA